jgi:hypothetical protein
MSIHGDAVHQRLQPPLPGIASANRQVSGYYGDGFTTGVDPYVETEKMGTPMALVERG